VSETSPRGYRAPQAKPLRARWARDARRAAAVIAAQLGHSDTQMVEKHYGHLAPSYASPRTVRKEFRLAQDCRAVQHGNSRRSLKIGAALQAATAAKHRNWSSKR
jgi:hypothetical protein